MIKKVASSVPGYVYVSFELPSSLWADRIFLVGDFNHWDEKATPMCQERDGVWRATLELPHGHRFEFRYLIDGKWMSDSHADGFAPNEFGVSNSIVHTTLPIKAIPSTDGHLQENRLNTFTRHVTSNFVHTIRKPSSVPNAEVAPHLLHQEQWAAA